MDNWNGLLNSYLMIMQDLQRHAELLETAPASVRNPSFMALACIAERLGALAYELDDEMQVLPRAASSDQKFLSDCGIAPLEQHNSKAQGRARVSRTRYEHTQ